MGLDSVELLMRFEKEFKKDIPNHYAESICTVGDIIHWFNNNLEIHLPDKKVENKILDLFKEGFSKLGLPNQFDFAHKLRDYLPKEGLSNTWNDLEKATRLSIPQLNPQDLTEKVIGEVKIWGLVISRPKKPILDMTFLRFIECVGALNYKRFVDFDTLSSVFEITIAVIGITHEQCGVDIDQIGVDSWLTKDLGID